jgi:hypothetical protein
VSYAERATQQLEAIRAKLIPLDEYRKLLNGDELVSDWVVVDQSMIDTFADATLDWQFIHVDPDRARETHFGGTIAHGFLTLSLLSRLAFDAMPGVQRSRMGVNYGFDRVRFNSAVKVSPGGADGTRGLDPVGMGHGDRGRRRQEACPRSALDHARAARPEQRNLNSVSYDHYFC